MMILSNTLGPRQGSWKRWGPAVALGYISAREGLHQCRDLCVVGKPEMDASHGALEFAQNANDG